MIQVRSAPIDSQEYVFSRAIRKTVFVEEQKVPEELEVENEEASNHFLALYGDTPAGTGRYRLLKERGLAKFERVCTLKEFRGKGIARALIQTMQKECREKYPDYLPIMHAQTSAMAMYEILGWVAVGEPFQEGALDHRLMILPPVDPSGLKCLQDDKTPESIRNFFKDYS